MATRTQMSTPTLTINDKVIAYTPNSLKWKDGDQPERKVTNLTSGGKSRTKLVAMDASTLTDSVTFDMEVSRESFDLVNEWQDASDEGGVGITISQGSSVISFRNMILTAKPEFDASVDGKVSIEFM